MTDDKKTEGMRALKERGTDDSGIIITSAEPKRPAKVYKPKNQ